MFKKPINVDHEVVVTVRVDPETLENVTASTKEIAKIFLKTSCAFIALHFAVDMTVALTENRQKKPNDQN